MGTPNTKANTKDAGPAYFFATGGQALMRQRPAESGSWKTSKMSLIEHLLQMLGGLFCRSKTHDYLLLAH